MGSPLRLRDAGLVVDQMVSCSPATMSGYYSDLMRHERTAGLKAFDGVPTTVMVGSADVLTPPSHARRLASAIEGARMFVLPGAGHYLPLERDEAVSAELVAAVERARP
jgi:pimeloyl-ACP methyl ester carboxylesterase